MADSDFRRQSRDLISFWQIKFSGICCRDLNSRDVSLTSGLDPFSFYILQMSEGENTRLSYWLLLWKSVFFGNLIAAVYFAQVWSRFSSTSSWLGYDGATYRLWL